MDTDQGQNLETNNNTSEVKNQEAAQPVDMIMDLPKLAQQANITNSDIILSIFEICTFNKKYNYDCSNNTKSFWDRVVSEGILKKIFKNFKSETLRKYWKIIRQTGDNDKFMEIVRQNENYINNPQFKLLPIINGISAYITSPPEEKQSFQDYFNSINIQKEKKSEPEEIEEENVDPRILEMGNTIDKLMQLTKCTREECFRALMGCTGNIKNAYLYLMDNEKYEKYFFYQTDDYVIKHLKNKHYYSTLIQKKGEDYVNEREKFLKRK